MRRCHFLEAVFRQWRLRERRAVFPTFQQELLVTLIDKPDRGLRPIAFFWAGYRAPASARVAVLQGWENGSECLDINMAAWRTVTVSNAAVGKNKTVADAAWR